MQTVVYKEYGSPEVLHIQEAARPTPGDKEVLIRIHATTVNVGDLMARNFKAISPRKFTMPLPLWLPTLMYFGITKPKIQILGSEFSGEVEATGKDVKRFKKGDQVFGYLGQSMGAYAEFLCVAEASTITIKPSNLSHEEAAVVPYGAIMALNLLRRMNIQPGQKVLVHGASGGIGSAAVQLAKYFGAHVTGVCGTPRLDFVRSLGADQVIDYTKQDFTQNGETYDLIFDILGKSSFARVKNSLKHHGRILYASFKMKQLFQMLWTSRADGKRVICGLAPGSLEDLLSVQELLAMGKLKAIVDKCFPLEQAAAAHRYAESGHKRGPIVITMSHGKNRA